MLKKLAFYVLFGPCGVVIASYLKNQKELRNLDAAADEVEKFFKIRSDK